MESEPGRMRGVLIDVYAIGAFPRFYFDYEYPHHTRIDLRLPYASLFEGRGSKRVLLTDGDVTKASVWVRDLT